MASTKSAIEELTDQDSGQHFRNPIRFIGSEDSTRTPTKPRITKGLKDSDSFRSEPETKNGGWLPDFLSRTPAAPQWLIDPFLPKGGIVLLHGPKSVGKSPLTWAMSTSVATGQTFFGYPVKTTGNVLYVELDTPSNLLHSRLSKLRTKPNNVWFEFLSKPINVLDLNADQRKRFCSLAADVDPALVVVNTLRKAHTGDDKGSDVPSRVYAAWHECFPTAAMLFVHHDRKESADSNPDQAFSGSQAWANDAQVVLHIYRSGAASSTTQGEYAKSQVTLKVTGSQVSDHELLDPMSLQLDADGTNWTETGPVAYRRYFLELDSQLTRSTRIEMTMDHFQKGKSAVYDAVKGL